MTYSAEPEAVRARKRRAARGDEVRAYHRAYAQSHRANAKAYEAKMRAEDPEGWKAKARDRMKKWRARNPERSKEIARVSAKRNQKKNQPKITARVRVWKQKNPERVKRSQQKYAVEHREHILAKGRRYVATHREQIAAVGAQHRQDRPEFHRLNEQKRRARKRRAPGRGVSVEQWAALVADHANLCVYCARPLRLTMEHVDPIRHVGAHDIENVVPACQRCNASKHDTPLLIWLARRAAA